MFERELNDGKVECFMRKGDSTDSIGEADIHLFLDATFEKFDDFTEHMFDFYRILFDSDVQDWKKATCTCPEFMSSFVCKHIVCIAYQLGLLDRPVQEIPQYLQPNPKKGRPAKASKGGLTKD